MLVCWWSSIAEQVRESPVLLLGGCRRQVSTHGYLQIHMRQRRESLQHAAVVLDEALPLAMNHRLPVQTIVRANDNQLWLCGGSRMALAGKSSTMYQTAFCVWYGRHR
jgi:hypothetical protein